MNNQKTENGRFLSIDTLYAFVNKDKDGNEGILGVKTADGWMPLIGADMDRVNSLKPIADETSKSAGVDYEIRTFIREEQNVNNCENPDCNNKSEMDVHMPLPIGLFRADMCMNCGLLIQDNMKTVTKIIESRAKAMGIKLPSTPIEISKLCESKGGKEEKCEIKITRDQLSIICAAFHKWFRVADCKGNADIDMYKSITKLNDKEYVLAMSDSLKEAGIIVEGM